MPAPFVLLDDARPARASDARFYQDPVEIVAAYRLDEVETALQRVRALSLAGFDLAGTLAYEAGLALEPRLAGSAAGRVGASGPLIWFGAFRGYETIPAREMPAWLAARAKGRKGSIGPLQPQLSPGGYTYAFSRLHDAILAGDIYQANLTFPLAGSWQGDPLALYAAIRPAASAGYGGIVHDGSQWLLSFSPELFFSLKDSAVTARPMKGTRPRDRNAAEDARLAAELAGSAKDRAENLMIVDLMRNDLARVALPGSVRVEDVFAVESYPTVHQMISTVRARLRPGLDAIDVIRALFPCGSITGTPKIRAMELIADIERDSRGPYCGAIGRIDAAAPNGSGDAAFNVAIRTLRLCHAENGQGQVELGVGSAIVADSEPLGEWRECVIKGGFLRQSVDEASAASFDLIETMAFTPEGGVALLELHLERIRVSAGELGFAFDRHAVRNAIQALCFDSDAPRRLRLLVARGGAYTVELAPMPPALPEPAPCAVLRLPVDTGDWRLRHKQSDRGFHDAALDVARGAGAVEAIFLRDDGFVTEGSFTNIFVERGDTLLTPPLEHGLLPGVLRRSLIDAGRASECGLTLADLTGGFLIGNAVRGLIPARLLS